MKEVLVLEKISKSFGGIHALEDVDFSLLEGEVHALLGENGAGKSTLIKILTGVHQKDSGKIKLFGKDVKILNPVDARYKGIAAIYQELSLIEDLSVAENIFLGNEPTKDILGTVNRKELFDLASQKLKKFNIDINPSIKISELGMGQKRIIEIIKALAIDAKILLLDEPTTGMSKVEIETLFKIMKDLKKHNVTMIYISHHLEEVFSVCDRATVLRDGKNVKTFEVENLAIPDLVQAMIGRNLNDEFPKRRGKPGDGIIFSIKNFKSFNMKHEIDLDLKKGEILGISGIIGSGKSELALGLFGVDKKEKGKIYIENKEVNIKNPGDAKKEKIAFIPEDRKTQGLFLNQNLLLNLTVANMELVLNNGVINSRKRKELSTITAEKLKVKPLDLKMQAQNLSGGNQQKIVVGKWLCGVPKIIIFDEPTRGIDVGAKTEIYNLINELADKGTGIIIISSEFKEISGVCDRILVFRNGKVAKEMSAEEATTENILTVALGG
ncbi:MAG: ribose transport system ATP-binding protein [Kosmotogales bacterium]|nr:ribose transport system ATP-binding protein [Kosmotogales bacterium]